MFSTDLQSLGRVALFAVAAYFLLLLLIRAVGPRSISKMNPSDFVITVAIGSTVANMILSDDVALAEGLVALSVLIGLQFITEWGSARSVRLRRAVEGEPKLLLYDGRFLKPALLREHVTETAVYKAIRDKGLMDVERVKAVVLEIDGSFSVLSAEGPTAETALDDVKRAS